MLRRNWDESGGVRLCTSSRKARGGQVPHLESLEERIALDGSAPTISAPASASVNANSTLVFSATSGNAITVADAGIPPQPAGPAGPIPYANVGQVAPPTSFSGTGGDVTAYFYGDTAFYNSDMAMLVNGVMTPIGFVFPNHQTAVGSSVDLGLAPVGASIVFELQVFGTNPVQLDPTPSPHFVGTPIYDLYSDPALNTLDHTNHIYSTSFTSAESANLGGLIPPGTFVAFEDLLNDVPGYTQSDLNYNDHDFVFTNVAPIGTDELSLTAAHGTLALGSTNGVSVTSGANGSGSMTVTGTVSDLNSALDGLEYVPASGYSGPVTLDITIDDPVDSMSASAAVAINVVATSTGPKVTSLLRYGFHEQRTVLALTFDEPLEETTALDTANYKIVALGGPARNSQRRGRVIPLSKVVYDATTNSELLFTDERLNIHNFYRLKINGTTANAVTDTQGVPLDGLGNSKPGSDFRAAPLRQAARRPSF